MLLQRLVAVSGAVTATRRRLEKRAILAALLREAGRSRVGRVVSYLSGRLPQGRIGLGPALLRDLGAGGATRATLTVDDLDRCLDAVAAVAGRGARARQRALLDGLWARATGEEAAFLLRLLLGELRQGALEGLLIEAIAEAAALPAAEVRRATMLAGAPAPAAEAALSGGAAALAAFRLTLLQPVQPMLAQPAGELPALFADGATRQLEYKLDGARVQLHRAGDAVRVFSRQLHDVSSGLPEVVERVRALPARSLILDGEVIALRADGTPHPFQTTMRRFGRRSSVERLRGELPLSVFLFDCLHLDGEDLIDRALAARLAALDGVAPALTPPRLQTAAPAAAQRFLASAFHAGHEGLMIKDLDSPYAAGSRGAAWRKLKQVHSLDLVVLAAEWGSGRREGWLSNLHLGARDPAGGFVMLGKTFKGLTDAMLRWQTQQLLALATARAGHVVQVRPALVVEIAVNELQRSDQYAGGLALRFARVKAYRGDKSAAEADTIDTVRALYERQGGTA